MKWYKKVDLKALFGAEFKYEQISEFNTSLLGGEAQSRPSPPPPLAAAVVAPPKPKPLKEIKDK